MTKMTRTLLATAALFLSLFFIGCGDDNVNPETADTTVYPIPDDAFGVLVGIKTYNEVSVAGFTTEIIFGSAVAAFVDGSNFLPAGTVTCNTEGLTQNSNNSYVYMPDFGDPTAATGLDLGNEAIWTVSGQGTVPAINESFVGFPSKPSITSSTTINSSADYTMTWSSISGADSLIASVYANNGNVSKTVAGNATSVVFTSSELNGVGTTNFGIIQVAAYKQKKEVVDGKNIYLINESVGTETNVKIE